MKPWACSAWLRTSAARALGARSTRPRAPGSERLTRISARLLSTSAAKVAARAWASGTAACRQVRKKAPTSSSTHRPWPRLAAIKPVENSGAAGSRGGRCITSGSSGSDSKAIEQAGSISSSRKAMCSGVKSSGQPSSSGSSDRPAIGTCTASTCTASTKAMALRSLSSMRRPSRTAPTMALKSSSSSTSDAASRATSVPRPPIAMPMCAAFSDGASLTPSPVIGWLGSRHRPGRATGGTSRPRPRVRP